MAEQKILISIRINDKEAANTNKALRVNKDNFDKLTDAELKSIVADKEKILSAKALDKSLTQQAASQLALANATDKTRTTSGLNNAILMETSRLASDASFGFTAIANNLSQLINLFKASKDATGSYMTSIKSLFTAQSALLIGIQLLITYGDDLYRLFKDLVGGSDLLKETFKDAGSEVSSTAGKFETYIRTLQDSNKSQEEQKKAIEALNKEFPDYIKQLEEAKVSLNDVANNTAKAAEQNDIYRDSLVALAMARAAQNKIDELVSEQLQNEIDAKNELKEVSNLTIEQAEELSKSLDEQIEKRESEITSIRKKSRVREDEVRGDDIAVKRIIDNRDRENKKLDEQIDALIEYTQIQIDSAKKGSGARNRIFKEADLDFEKEILSSQQRIEKLEARHEKDLIEIKINAMGEKAELKQAEFEQDQSRRLRDFLQSEATLKQKQLAEERYNNSIAESKESLYKYLIQLDNEYNATIADLEERRELEDLSAFGKALQTFNTERLKFQEQFLRSYTDSEIDRVEVAKQLENDRFNNEMLNLKAIREQRIADGETTFEIDQRIANAQKSNTEANIALAEQERDAKIAIANQVGNAIVAVAGEGSTVGKAASIAMAIMNTKEAFTAALGAKPYGAWNIAQAAAVLAMGMKQVRDIMAVKIPGKDPSAGGGMTIEAPDFNVVGASQTSQLAEAVSTQQAKPVKAFVVGKDISTQQELDRNITNTASFG